MINVKFHVLSLEDQISIIQSFLSSDSRQSRMVADYFGLNLKELHSLPERNRNIQIENVVTKLYNQKLEQMKGQVDVFQKAWDEKSDFINSEFRKIFGKEINLDCQGYVNLNPVWPRFLNHKSFDVNYKSNNDFLLLSCTHEIVHFAWFELWKSNFPEHSDEEFEYPNLPWLVSEIAIEPIFRHSKLYTLSDTNPAYDYFYTDTIEGKTIAQITNELYEQSDNINDFQNRMYNFFSNQEKKEMLIK